MDLLLTEQQNLLRDAAERLCAARGGAKRARVLRNAGTELDPIAWQDMIAAGFPAAMVGERHGGSGLGAFDLALVLEQTGRHILAVPLAEAAGAAWALSQAAAGREAPAALRALVAGACLIVPAADACAWHDARSAEPALRFDGGASSLAGTVPFAAFAASAGLLLVDAVADRQEIVLCLVPKEAPGLSIETRRNVDGSASSTVSFVDVEVARTAVVARGSTAATLRGRLHELLVLAAAAELLGLADTALHMTLDYLKLRHQFGRPIGSFQVLQHRMVNCFVDLELNRSLLFRVASAWDDGTGHAAMVAAVKARAARGALDTVRAALQLHGAIGYTDEHDIGLIYKRAVALAAKFGNEIAQVGRFSALTVPQGRDPQAGEPGAEARGAR